MDVLPNSTFLKKDGNSKALIRVFIAQKLENTKIKVFPPKGLITKHLPEFHWLQEKL